MAKSRPPLQEMTLRQLRKVASEYNISRYSRMRKAQLLEAILNIERQSKPSTPSVPVSQTQEVMEAAKFELGTTENTMSEADLASVDEGLPDLPGGYGKSRIVMMPRDPEWSYVYWDVPNEHKEELRRQGGQQLVLRLYDVTDVAVDVQSPRSIQEYPVDELAREWYVPIPTSDRDYLCEIGYRCADQTWLMLARSDSVHTPPVYPSDWIEDHFIEVNWEEQLETIPEVELSPPPSKGDKRQLEERNRKIYEEIFEMSDPLEGERMAGSFYGSMPHRKAMSSYVFPSGVGLWEIPPLANGESAIAAQFDNSPQFAFAGETELMISGSTEPQATVVVGKQEIKTNRDGRFRFQVSFTQGVIDYPIVAYAADGRRIFSLEMKFTQHSSESDTTVTGETVWQWS